MPEFKENLKKVEQLLKRARTHEKYTDCSNLYEFLGIERTATNEQIKSKIVEKHKFYQEKQNVSDWRIVATEFLSSQRAVESILINNRSEYNQQVEDEKKTHNIKELRKHFVSRTRDDDELDSKEKNELIKEGTIYGLSETQIINVIDRWMEEDGVKPVEAHSPDSVTSSIPLDVLLGQTYYEMLDVPEDADYAQIKDVYEREYKKYNETRDKARAEARWIPVSKAWECLKDPAKKREYDEKLKREKQERERLEREKLERERLERENLKLEQDREKLERERIEQLENEVKTGTPRLVVERKTDYTFRNVRRGDEKDVDKIVIKNPDGGMLRGTINSNVPWLKPDRNNILEKHEQELYIKIDTSKIPVNDYEAEGCITIDTNGGPPNYIDFRVILEGLEIAADRFSRTYVPLIAACAGLIASFSNSPILNFLIGAGSAGLIAYVFAKLAVKFFLNKGIDIFKLPPLLIQAAAVGVVILTIIFHSGGSSVSKNASSPARPPALDTKAKRPTPSINTTKAVIAAGLDSSQNPMDINTNFPSGQKRLYYCVSYNGAIADSTVFDFRWFKDGNQISSQSQYRVKSASSTNTCNRFNYNFEPGEYEARLFVSGNQIDRTSFSVSANSADTQKAEEQQQAVRQKEINDYQKAEAEADKAKAAKEALARVEPEIQRQEQQRKTNNNKRPFPPPPGEIDTPEIKDYLAAGRKYFDMGKYELCISKMEEVLKRDKNHPIAIQHIRMANEKINNIKKQFSNPTFGGSE